VLASTCLVPPLQYIASLQPSLTASLPLCPCKEALASLLWPPLTALLSRHRGSYMFVRLSGFITIDKMNNKNIMIA
jgi:hypothetical protein